MIPSEARGAWRELESKLRPYVARRVASQADVDEVIQEIFVRMHRGIEGLRDGERFGGWVYRIAARAIADAARSRARHHPERTLADEPNVEVAPAGDEESRELDVELTECVALFVARLASPYREAITLTELEGLTQKEAAEMLGVSLSGMKSRVQRGREKIREMFEACCVISVDGRGRVMGCDPRAVGEVAESCRDAAASWAGRRRA